MNLSSFFRNLKSTWCIALCVLFYSSASAQYTLPYFQNFDSGSPGWSHYATGGVDAWELGTPSFVFTSTNSAPNAWVSDLDSIYPKNTNMYLETPYFDLGDSIPKILSFWYRRNFNYGSGWADGANLEYSVDSGQTWAFFNPSKVNGWYNTQSVSALGNIPGFYGYVSSFQRCRASLEDFAGFPYIRFRFRLASSNWTYSGAGWMIDDFGIYEEVYNVSVFNGDTIVAAKHVQTIDVEFPISTLTDFGSAGSKTADYYFSTDPVLDSLDTLIGTYGIGSFGTISKTFNLIPNLNRGFYYIIYDIQSSYSIPETSYGDNRGYVVLQIDSTYKAPYSEDFENVVDMYSTGVDYYQDVSVWRFGMGARHHLEGAHSGTNSWTTSASYKNNSDPRHYIEMPYMDFSTDSNAILSFWFKSDAYNYVSYSITNGLYYSKLLNVALPAENDWDYMNISLANLNYCKYGKIRFYHELNYLGPEGLAIDDVYIGSPKADLTIERNKNNRFTSTSVATHDLGYSLFNSGLVNADTSTTEFYWSMDSILDAGDPLVGSITEIAMNSESDTSRSFSFTKPTLTPGKYYLFYKLDVFASIDEMRESNNIGVFTIYQQDPYSVPYYNDFETSITDWRHNTSLTADDWEWGMPTGVSINAAFSGTKAWITKASGVPTKMSRMHLYTPIFDLSTITDPVLEFDMFVEASSMNMSYSVDGGEKWIILDTTNLSYKIWYYHNENLGHVSSDLLFEQNEYCFAMTYLFQGKDNFRNTRCILDLDFLQSAQTIQFRYNLATSENDVNGNYINYFGEGALLDNFHIRQKFYDLNVPFEQAIMHSSLSNTLRFEMWIKNDGNYLSDSTSVNYYLSTDDVFDGSDLYLGNEGIDNTQPDKLYYINKSYSLSNLSNYAYLIYKIDPSNIMVESDELNNIGAWPLALDSIDSYPYFHDFNDTVVHGWKPYFTDS